jgi:hypothetical protein
MPTPRVFVLIDNPEKHQIDSNQTLNEQFQMSLLHQEVEVAEHFFDF